MYTLPNSLATAEIPIESCSENIESGQGGNNALAQDGDNTSTQAISQEQFSDMSSQVLSSD